jgi:DNA-binding response OmpR family regulator
MKAASLLTIRDSLSSRQLPVLTYSILLVSAHLALRKILHRLFSREGFVVEVAADGVTGLRLLRRRQFSAVILDLEYPVSSGCDFCRQVVDAISDAPLVLLSASPDIADQRLLLETGAQDYLTIPFSSKNLLDRLGVLLRRSAVLPVSRSTRVLVKFVA